MKMLTSLVILLVLIACGNKAEEEKSATSPRKVDATRESQNPIALTSARNKSGCSTESFTDEERDLSLSLFLQGQSVEENRLFAGLLEGLFVKDIGGKIISQSHKGQSILYTYVSNDAVITDEEKEISARSVVSVCPDEKKYVRGTVESVALNATYFISKTSRKVSDLLPDLKIAPISIEVAPMIKKHIEVIIKGEVVWQYDAFETDNAYYTPGENSITFLPHSEEFRKAGIDLNFWEVPMVASHEYGHHIFETLHPSPLQITVLKNCFGHFGFLSDKEEEAREVTNEDVLGALNEGFADLISFYTLTDQERGLQGVPCLEITRDVGSNVFANGTVKVFTDTALSDFFAKKEIKGPDSCEVPNYQDIHIIGAIFANATDRLLSLSTDTKEQRLAIVLRWLRALRTRQDSMKALSPEQFLRQALKLLVDVAVSQTDGKLDQSECILLKEVFPGFEGDLPACLPKN